LNLTQAIILSLLQGASELFPVSSLGHAIVFPSLLGWNVNLSDDSFLPFLVTLHLGTALALIIFYWPTWGKLIKAFVASLSGGPKDVDARMAYALIYATIPCAILGFLLEHKLKKLHFFSDPKIAAVLLIINGGMMIVGEHIRRKADVSGVKEQDLLKSGARKPIDKLTWKEAVGVGLAESLALFPGISRSGASMVGGLLAKLTHEDAARYSFLLATPIILAAGVLEVPKLRHLPVAEAHMGLYSAIGFVIAGVTAYLSVKFLTKYFETKRMDPFGYYCIALGMAVLFVLRDHV